MIRPAQQTTWANATFSDLQQVGEDCKDADTDDGSEAITGYRVAGSRVYYVQVGSKCSSGPDTCPSNSVAPPEGGLTRSA
jgi:hypothetical protein